MGNGDEEKQAGKEGGGEKKRVAHFILISQSRDDSNCEGKMCDSTNGMKNV
jgi:hypothetical protein